MNLELNNKVKISECYSEYNSKGIYTKSIKAGSEGILHKYCTKSIIKKGIVKCGNIRTGYYYFKVPLHYIIKIN